MKNMMRDYEKYDEEQITISIGNCMLLSEIWV